ncbi:MAG TPA: hypothetical protein VIT65_28305 [Microlunatus sp.]
MTVGASVWCGAVLVGRRRLKDKLKAMLRDHADGLPLGSDKYTVKDAVEDWLAFGLAHQAESPVAKYKIVCARHIVPKFGCWQAAAVVCS